jgi:hypothetical protein
MSNFAISVPGTKKTSSLNGKSCIRIINLGNNKSYVSRIRAQRYLPLLFSNMHEKVEEQNIVWCTVRKYRTSTITFFVIIITCCKGNLVYCDMLKYNLPGSSRLKAGEEPLFVR